MTQSLNPILTAMRDALKNEVLPEVTSDHARAQLAGVIDLLRTLQFVAVRSPDILCDRFDLIESGIAAITARAGAAGYPPPLGAAVGLPAHGRQADLERALRESEARLAILTDWLFDRDNGLPDDLRGALHKLMRETLRALSAAERRLVPRGDFSAMTGAAP